MGRMTPPMLNLAAGSLRGLMEPSLPIWQREWFWRVVIAAVAIGVIYYSVRGR